MLVVLTMRHITGQPSDASLMDGSRMLALLPRHWRKEIRQATRFAAIRIHTDEQTTPAHIRALVTAVLTNPEFSHWELLSCETLTAGHPSPTNLVPAAGLPPPRRYAQWN